MKKAINNTTVEVNATEDLDLEMIGTPADIETPEVAAETKGKGNYVALNVVGATKAINYNGRFSAKGAHVAGYLCQDSVVRKDYLVMTLGLRLADGKYTSISALKPLGKMAEEKRQELAAKLRKGAKVAVNGEVVKGAEGSDDFIVAKAYASRNASFSVDTDEEVKALTCKVTARGTLKTSKSGVTYRTLTCSKGQKSFAVTLFGFTAENFEKIENLVGSYITISGKKSISDNGYENVAAFAVTFAG